MPDKNGKPLIFSTRTLDGELSHKLEEAGITVWQKDFIDVKLEFDEDSFYQKLNNPDSQARIFTSKNSVFSLGKLNQCRPVKLESKKNFTVGVRATEMLVDFGIKASARAGNAISLAQIIARNKDVKSVDFFCGNKSLDDLPEYLESKGIQVHKEIVYKTDLVHHEVETAAFDGLIFLSPTAVYSFFKKNKINPKIPTFCIGATTSEAIHFRCDNKRIEAKEPSIASVVDRVIEHFTK
jgi:uroporphyrinogen-III synthase